MIVELVEAYRTMKIVAVGRPARCPSKCRGALKAVTFRWAPSATFMAVWEAVRRGGRPLGSHQQRYQCWSRLHGCRRTYASRHEVYEVDGELERLVALYMMVRRSAAALRRAARMLGAGALRAFEEALRLAAAEAI